MRIDGKNITLTTVELEDAEFIYNLRHVESKIKYLSTVDGTVKNQQDWIRKYKLRENKKEEFYFVIKSNDDERLGLVRLYDFHDDSFCWGSWILKEDAPIATAIESALQVYEFGFYELGFEKSHFDVRKENKKVIAFHQRFGAEIIKEDDLNYFFIYSQKQYENIKQKYKRYL